MNTDILGISELKWMEISEFNSDYHYIWASLVAQGVKNPPANAGATGDMDLIPGL